MFLKAPKNSVSLEDAKKIVKGKVSKSEVMKRAHAMAKRKNDAKKAYCSEFSKPFPKGSYSYELKIALVYAWEEVTWETYKSLKNK